MKTRDLAKIGIPAGRCADAAKRILQDAHESARRVLRERRATLDELSQRLLEKEVIEAEELKAIMGSVPTKDPGGTVPASVPDPGMTTN